MVNKTSRFKDYIIIVTLTFISLLIYLPSINAPFILDDNHMVTDNLFIKNPYFLGMFFKGYVTSYPIPKGMCRPLLMLTFAFNYLNGGLNPVGYHIVNILFHFLNATLLYSLLKLLKKEAPWGLVFLITLLFVVHPINTEAVTYISSRSDLMVTFFILLGFILYVKKKYLLTFFMYMLALLSKETALCLPLIFISYEFIYNINNKIPLKKWFKRNYLLYAGLTIATTAYLLYKMTVFSPTPTRILRSYYSNILIQSIVTFLYLKLFLFPFSLNIDHYIPSLNSFTFSLYLISIVGVVTLIIFLFISIKKHPLISFGLSWFLIGMLPKFYARLHFVSMEHHFYLPSIGIYIILLVFLDRIYSRHKRYIIYIGGGIIILFSLLAAIRNYEYNNRLLFWMVSQKRNPYSATIRNNLGVEYLKNNSFTLAEKEFKKALKFSKTIENKVNAKTNLANIYLNNKEYKNAEKEIKSALSLTKVPAMGEYQTLGVVYLKMGKEKEAIKAWEKEIEFYPTSCETYLNLGILHFKKENFKKAKEYFKKAIFYNPNHYAGYFGLAQILEKENKPEEAMKMYKKTISINPRDYASHYFLGALYAKNGDGRALYEFKKAIELNPRFAIAHNDLAVAYASMNPPNWELAKKEAEIAKSLGYKVSEKFLELIKKNIKKNK